MENNVLGNRKQTHVKNKSQKEHSPTAAGERVVLPPNLSEQTSQRSSNHEEQVWGSAPWTAQSPLTLIHDSWPGGCYLSPFIENTKEWLKPLIHNSWPGRCSLSSLPGSAETREKLYLLGCNPRPTPKWFL